MANDWWTEDTDGDDDYGNQQPRQGQANNLPNEARQHMRKIEKENKELREKLNTLEKHQRKASVSDLIKAKGYDPEIADFVPSDVDASEDAVNKWLETKGKFFAKLAAETNGDADVTGKDSVEGFDIPPEVMSGMNAVSNVSSGAITPTKPADLIQKIQSSNHEQLLELLKSQGATV